MKTFLLNTSLRFKKKPASVVTLGVFDGIHSGHCYILKKVKAEARKKKLKSLLISFHPHPAFFLKRKFPGYLTTLEEKISVLQNLGLDYFWVLPFNKKIRSMSGQNFIEYIKKQFDIKSIIVAEDFRFGYHAHNTAFDLRRICKAYGIEVKLIKRKKIEGKVITSSCIRHFIKNCDFINSRRFLGRRYFISGRVLHGTAVGKKVLKIPTINIDVDKKVLPSEGVYVTEVVYKGRCYRGVSNLGKAVTFKRKKLLLETYLFDFDKTIYNDFVQVSFLKKLRPVKKFPTVLHLKLQICKDIAAAKSCRHSTIY